MVSAPCAGFCLWKQERLYFMRELLVELELVGKVYVTDPCTFHAQHAPATLVSLACRARSQHERRATLARPLPL